MTLLDFYKAPAGEKPPCKEGGRCFHQDMNTPTYPNLATNFRDLPWVDDGSCRNNSSHLKMDGWNAEY